MASEESELRYREVCKSNVELQAAEDIKRMIALVNVNLLINLIDGHKKNGDPIPVIQFTHKIKTPSAPSINMSIGCLAMSVRVQSLIYTVENEQYKAIELIDVVQRELEDDRHYGVYFFVRRCLEAGFEPVNGSPNTAYTDVFERLKIHL